MEYRKSVIAFAALLSFFWLTPSWAQSLCATRLNPLPVPVSNNAVTSVPNADGTYSVYSFMGLFDADSTDIRPSSFRLDLPSGQWTQIADAPTLANRAKIGATAVAVAGDVYLIGGYTVQGNGSETTDDRLFRYNTESDSYTELATVPVGVDDTVAGVYQDRYIYVVSGWRGDVGNNTRIVQLYDTQTDMWQSADFLPFPFQESLGTRVRWLAIEFCLLTE